jgi:[citrate (pro-3S)-lyase] ligase
VFVVEENLSQFSFTERIAMVRDGVKHLTNVTVHPGSRYIFAALSQLFFKRETGGE